MKNKILTALAMIGIAVAIVPLCYLGWKLEMYLMKYKFMMAMTILGVALVMAIIMTISERRK